MKIKLKVLTSSTALSFFILFSACLSSEAATKRFEASGVVTSVDPVYQSVTIKHGAIKEFAGDGETTFGVASAELLKNINKRDLVDFTIVDNQGDVRVEKITRTGQADPEENPKMGKVVQDVLVGTGELAKGITTPIAPAHEVVSGAVGATTNVTGAVLTDADNKVKAKF